MKKTRKQMMHVNDIRFYEDVPVDDVLYKMDNREQYQIMRSKNKDVSLDEADEVEFSYDIADDYIKSQLNKCLREAVTIMSILRYVTERTSAFSTRWLKTAK